MIYNKGTIALASLAGALALTPAPASAQTEILFSESLLQSCILTLDVDGELGMTSSGTEMNSEIGNGGVPAELAVVAIGAVPTISFTAPALDAPGGDSGSVGQISWQALSGNSQSWTSSSSNNSGGVLIDAYVINGRITNDDGFVAGAYELSTTATCGQ